MKAQFFNIVIAALLLCIVTSCHFGASKEKVYVRPDEGVPTWEHVFDGGGTAVRVTYIDNNTFVVLADEVDSVNGQIQISVSLTAINRDHKILWRDTLMPGKHGSDSKVLLRTHDGNFVVGGSYQDVENSSQHAWLATIKSTGEKVWQEHYTNLPALTAISETPNGNITVAGVESLGSLNSVLRFAELTPDGKQLWQNDYGQVFDYGAGIINTKDGGFLLSMQSATNYEKGNLRTMLFRIDAKGDTLWTGLYKLVQEEQPVGVFENSDGGFTVIGVTQDTLKKDGIYTLRVDAKGKLLSSKTNFWEDDFITLKEVHRTAKGTFLGYGDAGNFRVPYRAFACEIDTAGNLIWSRSIARKDGARGGQSMDLLPDGSMVAIGYSVKQGNGNEHMGKGDGLSVITFPADGGKGVKAGY